MMAQSKSAFGFPDCREFLDRAVESEKGWRVRFDSEGKAKAFRLRCYTARFRELKRNQKIYSENEPAYFETAWHRLTFSIRKIDEGDHAGDWAVEAMHGEEALGAAGIGNEEIV